MAKVAIVYHSGSGRTKQVAEKIKDGVNSIKGVETLLLESNEAIQSIDNLDHCDTLLFGCPTYMGSVSADFKQFMDATGKKWMEQKWKDKLASGFTNSSGLNGDKANVINSLQIFAGQHSMIWISQGTPIGATSSDGEMLNRLSSWSGLMTQTETKEESPHPADLATAFNFGERVAQLTLRWARSAQSAHQD